ncbi:MAG: response regulator [Pseudomonadota bacterium]
MKELHDIVLVEDDPDIALLAEIALVEIGGFHLTHFASGPEALAGIDRLFPDLIILDYRMPGMNGDDVFRELRLREKTADTPIMFMTASVMPRHVGKLKELGAIDVLAKPFDPLTLSAVVRSKWQTWVSAQAASEI